ncbi:MAG: acyltransferase family protein [Gammaproteobacteria bacterium]|nr:acyltransferase family protein [Gammaproteobacteria bacterium]
MDRHFSIYLDLVRFVMAFAVFFYHSAFPPFLPWLPWLNVGHHAVITFFVLSGMVIAWVREHGDSTFRAYAISRVVRIYSVLLPTLALSIPAAYLGARLSPGLYADYALPREPLEFGLALLSNLLLTNANTGVRVSNFANTPIWSLCYEFWYYVFFAAVSFPRRRATRLLLGLGLGLLLGAKVLLLMPLWFLGVVVQRHWLRREPTGALAWALFLLPPALYLLAYFLAWPQRVHEFSLALVGPRLRTLGYSQHVLFDSLLALGIAAHFVGANRLAPRFGALLERFERPIRAVAAYTFSLYLLHYPLLHFFAAVLQHDPRSVASGLLLWGLTLGSAIAIGAFTEGKRQALKALVTRLLSRPAGPPVVEMRSRA